MTNMGKNDEMFFKAEKLRVLKKVCCWGGEGERSDQFSVAAETEADPSSEN